MVSGAAAAWQIWEVGNQAVSNEEEGVDHLTDEMTDTDADDGCNIRKPSSAAARSTHTWLVPADLHNWWKKQDTNEVNKWTH